MFSVLISLTICRPLQCKGKLEFIQHFIRLIKHFPLKYLLEFFFNISQSIQQRLEEFLFCSSKQILVFLLKFPTLAVLLICNDIYLNRVFSRAQAQLHQQNSIFFFPVLQISTPCFGCCLHMKVPLKIKGREIRGMKLRAIKCT